VIHEGTVDDLRARVDVKRIRCTSTLDIDVVRSWPAVSDAAQRNGHLHVSTVDAEAIVRLLLDADPALGELEVHRAGLAEAFTELTRESDTDATTLQREAA
ncbi:MAG TPA: ABC transporter ATP-binding protein, partial [Rhodanobacter sp.]|nr:ABC transporter ATP-binding protein [Rhodanobacter sp.]